MKRIATIGCFDGVHLGHRALLADLRKEADSRGLQPLVMTFAQHPLKLIAPDRAPRTLMPLEERVGALRETSGAAVEVLDFTPELRSLTAAEFLERLRRERGVEALLRGFNHHFGSDRLALPEAYARAGREASVEIIEAPEFRLPDGTAVSSSNIRTALAEGRVETASEMLGRNYCIKGTVGAGRRIGRTIGFPTANIQPDDPDSLIPAGGVYAVDVLLDDGQERRGMLNIGVRPTLRDGDNSRSIEVNILDYSADLYGHRMGIRFKRRLRDERTFDSLDSLRRQLEIDRHQAAE